MTGTSGSAESCNAVPSSRSGNLLSHSRGLEMFRRDRPQINVQYLLLCSAGKREDIVVSDKLGLLIRNTEKLYNSHKIFNQIISTVV